jgi:UPF0716 family protein affecting phage T7 exclusion
MFSLAQLVKFWNFNKLLETYMFWLFISLLPLSEIYLSLLLADRFGTNVTIGSLAAVSFLGLLLCFWNISLLRKKVRQAMDQGSYPRRYFYQFSGALFMGILFVMPGFISGALALLLCLSRAAQFVVGKMLSGDHYEHFYEHLKLHS